MLLRNEPKRQRRAAFTLMEMLVVVAIIVLLASIGGFAVMTALTDSRKDVARLKAVTISKACDTYNLKRFEYPGTLQQLLVKDEQGGPYLESADALLDPWGKEFQYDRSGPHNRSSGKPDIFTTAPDGEPCGNWNPKTQGK